MALKDAQQLKLLKPRKRNKYGACGFYDATNVWWASKWEHERYQQLIEQRTLRQITQLTRQVKYPLVVNGVKIATYIADAEYWTCFGGQKVVEDCKCHATMTATYRIKKKLMKALYNIDVVEVFRAEKTRGKRGGVI